MTKTTPANTVATWAERGAALSPPTGLQFWGMPVVVQRTGLHRATIYKLMKNDAGFPRARRLGCKRVAWVAAEVETWMASRQQAA